MSLLESQAVNEATHPDAKNLAQLRIAERTLNFEIDQFMKSVDHIEDKKGWNELKERRDALADVFSKMLEMDKKSEERYKQYCENLKNHRSIGAML